MFGDIRVAIHSKNYAMLELVWQAILANPKDKKFVPMLEYLGAISKLASTFGGVLNVHQKHIMHVDKSMVWCDQVNTNPFVSKPYNINCPVDQDSVLCLSFPSGNKHIAAEQAIKCLLMQDDDYHSLYGFHRTVHKKYEAAQAPTRQGIAEIFSTAVQVNKKFLAVINRSKKFGSEVIYTPENPTTTYTDIFDGKGSVASRNEGDEFNRREPTLRSVMQELDGFFESYPHLHKDRLVHNLYVRKEENKHTPYRADKSKELDSFDDIANEIVQDRPMINVVRGMWLPEIDIILPVEIRPVADMDTAGLNDWLMRHPRP